MSPDEDGGADHGGRDRRSSDGTADTRRSVVATRGLLDALCRLAADREPSRVSAALATTPASDLTGDTEGVRPEAPVFTDFYLPQAHQSVSSVFGMDVSVPNGQTRGRFLSHPDGDPRLTKLDDFGEVVFVAIPPWGPDEVSAYDRRGRDHRLVILDAEPPIPEFESGDDHGNRMQ